MIIAVDFDGTIQLQNKEPNLRLIAALKAEQQRGNIVILWTCRAGESLRECLQFCGDNGFRPNLVNQNHPAVIKQFGHDPRKVFADLYIDDKGEKPW